MKLYSIETGNIKIDGGAMFGVVPKVVWQKRYPAEENNLCNWAMRSLLIENGDRNILIDTGMGDKQDEKFFRLYHPNGDFSLKKSLKEAGFSPGDITDVILTHLHFDHCGGAIDYDENRTKLQPAFPNATYYVCKAQWKAATHPNDREKASFLEENILPIEKSGRLSLVEEAGELMPNVEVRLFNGHTDGQLIPFIKYNGKTLVYVADFIPAAVHVPMAWVPSYDLRPLVTLDEKDSFYREALENKYVLFFEHDLYNECCTLKTTPKGTRVDKTFCLQDFIDN